MRAAARRASACRPRSGRSRPSAGCSSATGRCPPIVDAGHQRDLDLALELPDGELEAVASAEQMGDVLDRIAALVGEHRTTLVFVNTRRLAERLAHQLGERLGDDVVAAHHGSLSKDRRHRVETRLRAGDLQALVATASLELGIDIGPVELVCQIGSPRSIATFLQRVGRSNHTPRRHAEGPALPATRDELVECAALLAAVRARPPRRDPAARGCRSTSLAQQIVAEVARAGVDDRRPLRARPPRRAVHRARPATQFDEVVDARRRRHRDRPRARAARYVHHDAVNGELRGRKGARLAALTSGGAIPETGDYRVVAEPDDTFIGTVNEDWAVESMAGDIFLLGTHSWQIRRVEPGVVRVRDAGDAPPTVPFWLGEAPARTAELSAEVSELRAAVDELLAAGDPDGARAVADGRRPASTPTPPTMIVDYLAVGRAVLGVDADAATTSCSSASSTRPAACSSSSTRRSAGASTARSGSRCARSSAARSTSSCRPRPATTRSCSRSARTTASRSTRCRATSRSRDGRGHARAGDPRLADVPGPLALEPQPRRCWCCASGAAAATRRRSSAWSPTT